MRFKAHVFRNNVFLTLDHSIKKNFLLFFCYVGNLNEQNTLDAIHTAHILSKHVSYHRSVFNHPLRQIISGFQCIAAILAEDEIRIHS